VSFSYASTDRGNVREIYEAHYELREEDEPPPWDAAVRQTAANGACAPTYRSKNLSRLAGPVFPCRLPGAD
jgi:hypothetical protein